MTVGNPDAMSLVDALWFCTLARQEILVDPALDWPQANCLAQLARVRSYLLVRLSFSVLAAEMHPQLRLMFAAELSCSPPPHAGAGVTKLSPPKAESEVRC